MRVISSLCLTIIATAIMLTAGPLKLNAADQQKPGAEEKIFQIALGEWEYEGEGPDTPFYPAGKFKGRETIKMALNGFFMHAHWKEEQAEGLVMVSYDRVAKTYRDHSFESDGSTQSGTTKITNDGKTWVTMSQRHDAKGKRYEIRYTSNYAADGKSRKATAEYSEDGKMWKPLFQLTSKKVK